MMYTLNIYIYIMYIRTVGTNRLPISVTSLPFNDACLFQDELLSKRKDAYTHTHTRRHTQTHTHTHTHTIYIYAPASSSPTTECRCTRWPRRAMVSAMFRPTPPNAERIMPAGLRLSA